MLLNGSNIKKMFGDELLFDGVSFTVDDNDKIGFVGANGAGKSTLFKIISDTEPYDDGSIFKNKQTKIGYLEQFACNNSDKTLLDEMTEVFSDIIEAEHELEDIRFDIENNSGDLDALIRRQNYLNEYLAQRDGFYYKSRVRSMLIGLGFSEDEFSMRVSQLSGGQKTRISLGKILLSDSNLLLLDEPTNHLDIQSVEWLEDFLKSYKGAFIVISHDRYFLDRVTNKTFELENSHFYSFNGNYSFYSQQKEIDKKTMQRRYENTKKEITRLEGIVEQQRRWNREKNIKTAESKLKVIDRLEKDLVEPEQTENNMFYNFTSCGGGGNDVLITEGLAKSFDGNRLFSGMDIHITKGERVFLLGPNGCGKTTLLKIIMDIYEQDCGTYKIGANIFPGYYDQMQENLSMNKTILEEITDEYPHLTQTDIRSALAAFLFKSDDVFKQIDTLSGGERARVELVKLILKKINFLILDEPTNHLDIESREALENALCGYDGTMFIVSHDRYFINKLATRIIYMNSDGAQSYSGNYDYYLEKAKNVLPPEEKKSETPAANDYQEQKRLAAQKRKALNRYKKVEELIADTENEIEQMNAELALPEIATDYIKATEITTKLAQMESELENLYEEWERLEKEVSQL